MARNSLGKGLDMLFMPDPTAEAAQEEVQQLEIGAIVPDANQNRTQFPQESLEELARSIEAHGVIQPLIVRPLGGGSYQLIAGERRWRAAQIAGLSQVPAIVRSVNEKEAAEMALIENLQREDLNPVDEALGFQRLIDQFGITQEEAAQRVGRSRSAVTNSLRLLSLPDSAKNLLKDGVISAGHARALLSLKDADRINAALCRIIDGDLSVRETEALVKGKELDRAVTVKPGKTKDPVLEEHYRQLSAQLTNTLGRKVKITPDAGGKGRLILEYYDTQDLEEILAQLCPEDFLLG